MTHDEDEIAPTDEELALAERGAALVAAAMAHPEARAPQALRDSLERVGTSAERLPRRRWGRPGRRLFATAIAAACVVAVSLAVVLGGPDEGAGSPSVEQVAAVMRGPALQAAPVAVGGGRLSVAVQGLSFPDWRKTFAWKASGRRADRIGNHTVTTVFYRYDSGRRRLGYAIVAGPSLRPPAGRDVVRGGVRYRVVTRAGGTTVTWTQAGHTCVIDAPFRVPADELVRLAAWASS
jgi:hypothetical protein